MELERRPAFQDRFSWSGTDDPTALLSLAAALQYLQSIDWPSGRERARRLGQQTQADALARLGGEPIAPSELQAPLMIAFPVPFDDAEAVEGRLRGEGIEIPIHRVGDRMLARLSVAPYTTDADCERLVDALERLAADART